MEPLCLPPHDEEDEFQKSLLDLLGSPIARHHNGASNIFNADYNSTYGYELVSHGSLGSPDFTRQNNLSAVGLHDNTISNSQQHTLPSFSGVQLQLPQPWLGGWHPDSWLPQSPTCPTLDLPPVAPLTNGNGFHIEQLLADSVQQSVQGATKQQDTALWACNGTYAPVTPQQQGLQLQLPQACTYEQQEPALWLQQHGSLTSPTGQQQLEWEQQQQQQQQEQQQEQQQGWQQQQEQQQGWQQQQQQDWQKPAGIHQQPHLPPGLCLVPPTAPLLLPAVHQDPDATAATNNKQGMRPGRPQQPLPASQRQKRQPAQQQAGPARKAARTASSTSPTAAAAAAAAARQQRSTALVDAAGALQLASPVTPTMQAVEAPDVAAAGAQAVAAASSQPATPTVRGLPGQLELGTLVWGKVARFPWWPAVLVPPSSADQHALEEQAAADAAQQAGSHSSRPLVFVRFLGTHDTAWLAPSKVSPWTVQLGDRSSKTKAAAFVSALKEARAYAGTGALPDVFADELPAAVSLRHVQEELQDSRLDADQQQQQQQQQQQSATKQQSGMAGVVADSSASDSDTGGDMQPESAAGIQKHSSSSRVLAPTTRPQDSDANVVAGAGADHSKQKKGGQRGDQTAGKRRVGSAAVQQPTVHAARATRRGTAADVRHTRSGMQLRG